MSFKSKVLSPGSFFKATNISSKKKFIDSNKFWWFSGKKVNAIFCQEFLKEFKKDRKFRDAIFGDEPTFNKYKHLFKYLKREELEPLILEGFYSGALSPDILKDIESLPAFSVQHPEIKPPEFYAKPVPPIKYRKFSIPKRGKGIRKIQQPHAELMALQRKILPYLEDNYPPTKMVYGFIPGKNIVGAAEKHLEAKILFNIDLKDAFTSVNLDHLKRGLKIFFGEKNSGYLLKVC
ncbi:MAG: reverse transcriptase domain-containing protein, partial [Actinomycetota bacterium]|nr:reverse transcriptase domain-containing protein [Actinomycetota bacterium]